MARRTKNFDMNMVSLEMADTWIRIDISKADAYEEDPVLYQKVGRCEAVEVQYEYDDDSGELIETVAVFYLEHVGRLTLNSRENSWLVTSMWEDYTSEPSGPAGFALGKDGSLTPQY